MWLLRSLRQNLMLKLISLAASILLYYYVQTQRNPQITLMLQAHINLQNVPSGIEAQTASKTVPVQISGPKILVENLKDGDVEADVQINGRNRQSGAATLPIAYSVPGLRADAVSRLHIDGPLSIRVALFSVVRRLFTVHLPAPPAHSGIVYGRAQIVPTQVTCSGHTDAVNRVRQVVITGLPYTAGQIDDLFRVEPMDRDGDLVDGVTLNPSMVQAQLLALAESPVRLATVSVSITSLPLPPYVITGIHTNPLQVQVSSHPGSPGAGDVVRTEPISLKDAAASITRTITLQPPAGVEVMDLQGRPLRTVQVTIDIARQLPAPAPSGKPAAHLVLPGQLDGVHP